MSTGLLNLSGKVAIVTGSGANGGIGHAIAPIRSQPAVVIFV